MNDKLLPCPFCAQVPELETSIINNNKYYIETCLEDCPCDAGLTIDIEKWNTRVPHPAERKLEIAVKALNKILNPDQNLTTVARVREYESIAQDALKEIQN